MSLEKKDPDLTRKVRKLLPNALVVRADVAGTEARPGIRLEPGALPATLYGAFHLREHEREVDPAVLNTFQALHADACAEE